MQVQVLGNLWEAQAQVVKAIKAEMLHQHERLIPSMLQAVEAVLELLGCRQLLQLKLLVVTGGQALRQPFLGQL